MAAETKSVVTSSSSPAQSALEAELARLKAENEALRSKAMVGGKISLKVSEKGCVSLYGLGRFPVTLYAGQWERLLTPENAKAVLAFIAANEGKVARK